MSHLAFYFYNSGTIPLKEGEEECKVRKTKNKVCFFVGNLYSSVVKNGKYSGLGLYIS